MNKTESAVKITHVPTGITATCQQERSQHQNKKLAMSNLLARLLAMEQQRKQNEKEQELATMPENSFGNQIRSYVLFPYKLVKDNRTNVESNDPEQVLQGNVKLFMLAFLRLIC